MNLSRFAPATCLCLVLLATTACGSLAESSGARAEGNPGSKAIIDSAAVSQAIAAPRSLTGATVVYVVPPAQQPGDADVSATFVTIGGSSRTTSLGRAVMVAGVPSNGPQEPAQDIVQAFDYSGQLISIRLGSTEARSPKVPASNVPAAVVGPGGRMYRTLGNTVQVLESTGQLVATLDLPVPVSATPSQDGKPIKGPLRLDAAQAGGLLVGPDGHLYVLATNGVNSVVADLTTGRRSDVPGYGAIVGATVAADGLAYAVLRNPERSRNTFVIGQFDLVRLKLLDTFDTLIRVDDGALDDLAIVATRSLGVFVYGSKPDATGGHQSILLRLNGKKVDAIALPANLGTRVTVGVNDQLYLFSGPARNVVTVVDPLTGTNHPETLFAAPANSYILAVFTR